MIPVASSSAVLAADLREGYDPVLSSATEKRFIRDFIKKPGEHLIEIGRPGTGKTQGLYFIIEYLKKYTKETVLYFDIGKGAEIITLLHYFGPATIILLPGTSIDLTLDHARDSLGREYDIRFKTVSSPRFVWGALDKGRTNIAIFEPFILDEVTYLNEISEMFRSLIRIAHRGGIIRPLSIVYDEFQNVAPSDGYGFALSQKEQRIQRRALNYIKKNVQKLRTLGIRLIVTSHEWYQIFKGVRTAFEWVMIRRGANFGGDEPNLSKFNPRWSRCETGYCYIAYPTREHSNMMALPLYTDGKRLGMIRYRGVFGDDPDGLASDDSAAA